MEELEQLRAENARLAEENARLWAAVERVRTLAHQMRAEHGQSWNSISGRRVEEALGEAGR